MKAIITPSKAGWYKHGDKWMLWLWRGSPPKMTLIKIMRAPLLPKPERKPQRSEHRARDAMYFDLVIALTLGLVALADFVR